MHITIKWFDSTERPSFNVQLSSKEGAPEFLSIKGCRIAQGSKGEFVSWPSTKTKEGNYWNHVWGSDKFNEAVLAEALKSRQGKKPAPANDFDDEIPF